MNSFEPAYMVPQKYGMLVASMNRSLMAVNVQQRKVYARRSGSTPNLIAAGAMSGNRFIGVTTKDVRILDSNHVVYSLGIHAGKYFSGASPDCMWLIVSDITSRRVTEFMKYDGTSLVAVSSGGFQLSEIDKPLNGGAAMGLSVRALQDNEKSAASRFAYQLVRVNVTGPVAVVNELSWLKRGLLYGWKPITDTLHTVLTYDESAAAYRLYTFKVSGHTPVDSMTLNHEIVGENALSSKSIVWRREGSQWIGCMLGTKKCSWIAMSQNGKLRLLKSVARRYVGYGPLMYDKGSSVVVCTPEGVEYLSYTNGKSIWTTSWQ